MVELTVEGIPEPDESEELLAWSARVLELTSRGEAELSLVLCHDAFIADLNAKWRGRPQATDVLSFPQDAVDQWEFGPPLLGDVVISVETASRQAAEQGHPLRVELAVLLVHGVLHLCGYDHQTEQDASVMRQEESKLLEQLGLAHGGLVGRDGPVEG